MSHEEWMRRAMEMQINQLQGLIQILTKSEEELKIAQDLNLLKDMLSDSEREVE